MIELTIICRKITPKFVLTVILHTKGKPGDAYDISKLFLFVQCTRQTVEFSKWMSFPWGSKGRIAWDKCLEVSSCVRTSGACVFGFLIQWICPTDSHRSNKMTCIYSNELVVFSLELHKMDNILNLKCCWCILWYLVQKKTRRSPFFLFHFFLFILTVIFFIVCRCFGQWGVHLIFRYIADIQCHFCKIDNADIEISMAIHCCHTVQS